MRGNLVASSIGQLLMIIGIVMLVPTVVGFCYQEAEYQVFLFLAAVTTLIGYGIYRWFRPSQKYRSRFQIVEGYTIVTYGWIVVTLFAMLPYLMTGTVDNVADAFFETMSGFTTVGASILNDIEGQAHCVLLWRSITHWLGGMGILVLFVALFSSQGMGTLHIYRAESSGPVVDKFKPKMMETARSLWIIYICNTALLVVLYLLCGMSLFDAINHGFSVISTGGFSTKNLSIGYYDSILIDWVSVFGMFLAGINCSLFFYAYRSKSLKCFLESLELRVYSGVVVVAAVLVVSYILPQYQYDLVQALRYGAFQVVSILTTTGLITCDYEQWVMPAQVVLILLMLCGACAGSTTGGIKIDRHVMLFRKMLHEVRHFLHPHIVTRLKSKNGVIDDDVILSVSIFFYIYSGLLVIGTLLLTMMGCGFFDGLTAVMSCLGGTGPAIGAWGPTESYASMPTLGKWLLSFLMLVGRLEIYTVLVLLCPSYKKKKAKK